MASSTPAARVIALVGGSSLLKSDVLKQLNLEERTVETRHGKVLLHVGSSGADKVVVVQRHAAADGTYVQPHAINYSAVAVALQEFGATNVVGLCSVGALHQHTALGSIIVPDDFWCPYDLRSGFDDARSHISPGFSSVVRSQLVRVLKATGFDPSDGGVYVNSRGPRFETKAEIRHFATLGDMVGMTCAHEATACQELGLEYAAVAIIDNYCNGIKDKLTFEAFKAQQKTNLPKVERLIRALVTHFPHPADTTNAAAAGAGGGAGAGAGAGAAASSTRTAVDLIVSARWVVCVEPSGVLDHHSVVVKDRRIVEVLPTADALAKYDAAETEDLGQHVLLPGLVNCHTHTPMVYMSGLSDDLPLLQWLTTAIWPTEAKCASADFVHDGALQACAEMIRGGTTCANDMYFFPNETAKAFAKAGLRAAVGMVLLEFPTQYASNADDYFTKGLGVKEAWTKRRDAGDEAAELITFTMAAHAPYTVTDDSFVRVNKVCKEHRVPIHVHLHETAAECADSVSGAASMSCHKSDQRCRPFKNLDRLGLVHDRLIAVHMTQMEDDEIARCAEAGTSVVHCPVSNLKLASGFCPVAKLVEAGVNVAIGTDGAASNNTLDMFAELKLAACLAKGVASDATAVPAATALRMATLNGAKALGLGDVTGSLQAGKFADMIAVRMDSLEVEPTYNVVSHLVYVCSRHNVSDVWVAGKRLLRKRALVTLNEVDIKATMRVWQKRVLDATNEQKAAADADAAGEGETDA